MIEIGGWEHGDLGQTEITRQARFVGFVEDLRMSDRIFAVFVHSQVLELELELYFYLNTVNLSDKIIIIKITIYFYLNKHDQKLNNKKIN